MRGAALILVLCLLGAGCGGGDGGDSAVAPPAETTQAAEAPNRPSAPAIAGETHDGERISLADFLGKPVFVNVWSSW